MFFKYFRRIHGFVAPGNLRRNSIPAISLIFILQKVLGCGYFDAPCQIKGWSSCFLVWLLLNLEPGQVLTTTQVLQHCFSTPAVQTETFFCLIATLTHMLPSIKMHREWQTDHFHTPHPSGWGWSSQTELLRPPKRSLVRMRDAPGGRVRAPTAISNCNSPLLFVFRFFCQNVVCRKVSEQKPSSIIFGHSLTAITNQFFIDYFPPSFSDFFSQIIGRRKIFDQKLLRTQASHDSSFLKSKTW